MKALKNIVCGLGLMSLIAAPIFANEPTTTTAADAAQTATDAAATAKEATHTAVSAKKVAKKTKKAAKKALENTTTTPEAHPTGN